MRLITSILAIVALTVAANITMAQPVGYFTDVRPVLADPNFSDFVAATSPDGLTLYFTSFNRTFPSGIEDIFVATRPDTASAFGIIQTLGSPINTSQQEDVGYISPDGKTIYFGSNRDGSEDFDLYQATRESVGDAFDNVTGLGLGVNTALGENAPRLTPDGKTIVFHRSDPKDPQRDIWLAKRGSTAELFGDAELVLATEYQDWWPSISADARTLFFSDWVFDTPRPGGRGGGDIWVSYRSSIDDPFGSVVNLNDMWPGTEINTPDIDGVPYISPDWPAPGSKLYFVSNTLTNQLVADVFQATWVPEPSAFVLTTIGLMWLLRRRR